MRASIRFESEWMSLTLTATGTAWDCHSYDKRNTFEFEKLDYKCASFECEQQDYKYICIMRERCHHESS